MGYQYLNNDNQGVLPNETELWIMVHSLNAIKRKNIPLCEGVSKSLEYLEIFYESTKDKRYIDVALLEIKAFLVLGGAYYKNSDQFNRFLSLEEIEPEDLLKQYGVKHVKLNKNQIKGLIRKWMPSRENPMRISEVADDILQKVLTNQVGRYFYSYKRNGEKLLETDVYELIEEEKNSYFHDVNRMQYYLLDKR